MSAVRTFGILEQNLAVRLLYGLFGPLNTVQLQLSIADTAEKKLSVTENFIGKYLSKDGKSTAVDLQDRRILELFDEAVNNMAQNAIELAIRHNAIEISLRENLSSMANLARMIQPPTWKDLVKKKLAGVGSAISNTIHRSPTLKKGADAAYRGLSRMGVISQKQEESHIVLIEEEDGWHELETGESYHRRTSLILEKWQRDPSILLEMSPTKETINTLRNALLANARKAAEQV